MDTTIELTGEIDVEAVPSARTRLYDAIDAHPGEQLTVQLDGITFIDSSGLGRLVGELKRARLTGGDLTFTRPPDTQWKVFTITGLDRALPFR